MSDIITKLERVKQTKEEIRAAIATKGASCETDCFREYPERILAISSGGSSSGGSSSGGDSSTSIIADPTLNGNQVLHISVAQVTVLQDGSLNIGG